MAHRRYVRGLSMARPAAPKSGNNHPPVELMLRLYRILDTGEYVEVSADGYEAKLCKFATVNGASANVSSVSWDATTEWGYVDAIGASVPGLRHEIRARLPNRIFVGSSDSIIFKEHALVINV